MLEQRQQRYRRDAAGGDLEREPREDAIRRICQRAPTRIVHRHLPALHQRRDAAAKAYVRRHQRGGFARGFDGLAQSDRDGERFFLGIGGLDHGDGVASPRRPAPQNAASASRSFHSSLAAAGRNASETMRSRPCGCGLRQRFDVGARDADPLDERGERELRMPVRGVAAVGDRCPGRFVEIGVEAGQHHGAVRQSGDGFEQRRGRRNRAGGAGGNDRACGVSGASVSASIKRSRRSAGSMRPCSVEDRRPVLADEFEEAERQLPVFVELVRHQIVELDPSSTCRVVMSSISRARSCASAKAVAGLLATSGVSPRRRGAIVCAHLRISAASGMARSRPESAGGSSSAASARSPVAASAKAISSSSMSPSGTMRGRMAASVVDAVEEDLAHHAAGAPRRQIERRAGELERVGQKRKARHFLDDERVDQRRQKRRRGGDGEDVGFGRHRANHTRFAAALRLARAGPDRSLGAGDGVDRADMHPQAFQPQAVAGVRLRRRGRTGRSAEIRPWARRQTTRATGSPRRQRRRARPRARRARAGGRPAPWRNRRGRHSRSSRWSAPAAAARPSCPPRSRRRAARDWASRRRSTSCRS